jgi:hypothetical protein
MPYIGQQIQWIYRDGQKKWSSDKCGQILIYWTTNFRVDNLKKMYGLLLWDREALIKEVKSGHCDL